MVGGRSTQPRRGIRDVAAFAEVSVGTVSNVLNNPELVAELTRARVLDAIRTLGFVRNGSARQLRAGLKTTVGALVLDIANPFFTEVARGIEDRLAEDDGILMLCSSDESQAKESRYLRLLEEQGVRGILVTPTRGPLAYLDEIRQRGTAVVLLDRTSSVSESCSAAVDDVLGGELAAGHLLSLGHRRIAFLNGSITIRQCVDRRRGVRRAVRAAGLSVDDDLIELTVATLNADGGEEALNRLMAIDARPTAVICVNDLTALGVLRGLRDRGLRVPEDIAVVGYDDVEFAAMLSPALTSVRQPKYQLGRAAAELLMAESDEGTDHKHRKVLFQPELIVRASSTP